MRKSKYAESDKLTAVWKMKEIVYNKTKGMEAGTGAKPASSTVRFGKKRVA
jgi:hypothetical protein